ncbi:MAG: sensor domain-containing diguanylate cyclase [Bacilli bacterium]
MENYSNWSRQDLINLIASLEEKIKHENEQFLINFPWAGNLGQWVWFYDRNIVHFNKKKVAQLGYDPNIIGRVGFEFFTSKLHPDDYDRVMDNMKKHLMGITAAYEVEYRIKHRDGHYLWYYDRGTVTKRDSAGQPLLIEGIVFDISKNKTLEERLLVMAQRDPLTGVYNRRMLFHHLQTNISHYLEQKTPFSMIMLDIDYFKEINDSFGHLVGDEVLKNVTKEIAITTGNHDYIYRYGGDEFFILLPNMGINEAKEVASQLHRELTKLRVNNQTPLSISMGVAQYQKETDDSFLKVLDECLYRAKKGGRNQVCS